MKINEDTTVLGYNIRSLRKFYNISARKLAEDINVNKDTILRWERGEIFPSAGEIESMVSYFNVPKDLLLNVVLKTK
jgi:transcriptional regulator with XRE-family HTH domain